MLRHLLYIVLNVAQIRLRMCTEWWLNYIIYSEKTGLRETFEFALMSIFAGFMDNGQSESESSRFLPVSVRVFKLSHSPHNVFISLKTAERKATHLDRLSLFPHLVLLPEKTQKSRNANLQTLVPHEMGPSATPATVVRPDRATAAYT